MTACGVTNLTPQASRSDVVRGSRGRPRAARFAKPLSSLGFSRQARMSIPRSGFFTATGERPWTCGSTPRKFLPKGGFNPVGYLRIEVEGHPPKFPRPNEGLWIGDTP